MMNKMLGVIGVVMILLVFFSATCATLYVNAHDPWYVNSVNVTEFQDSDEQTRCGTIFLCGTPVRDWLGFVCTFIVLYNNCVPISLMVTVEACNMVQGILIGKDAGMYYGQADTPALTRSSGLSQEIGQIEYIFSDKTGTLTCNDMVFKCAYVDGKTYGSGEQSEFNPKEFLHDIATAPAEKREALMLFRLVLSVAHTIVAEEDEEAGTLTYQAESPDEAALVSVASEMESTFVHRSNQSVLVADKKGKRATYEILAVNEFDSTRKRMSVLCLTPDGRYLLLCKGADNVIIDRSLQDPEHAKASEELKKTLHRFATEGLRTLVIAYREISEEEYQAWKPQYHAATVAIADRSELLSEAAEIIEKDLVILGATAIEDRLQTGVPQCIADLRYAGIKLWVLTGDKMETAINIGA